MSVLTLMSTDDYINSFFLQTVSEVSNSSSETASSEVMEEITVSDDVISRLDTVIEGLEGIFTALWLLIGILGRI